MRVTLTVNGAPQVADDVWEGESLLFMLRERLGMPGSKNACEQGECGSCTVWMDGDVVCACLVAAGQAEGSEVRTVEGLAPAGGLSVVQQAFLDAGAVQCGFCTPGLVVAADDLLRRHRAPGDGEIREALAGNLCRCTGYQQILDAVLLASERLAAETPTSERPAADEPTSGRPAADEPTSGRLAADEPAAERPTGPPGAAAGGEGR